MDIFIYLAVALFSVLNPIGTIPIFVGLTQGYTKNERSSVALTASINVCIILLISFFVGQYVLTFFGITITALRIAGGIIITNSGFSLLNGKFSKNKGINKKVEKEIQERQHIALTPLAMPMLAGPGSISLLIAYYKELETTDNAITTVEILSAVGAMLAVALLIFIILRSAHYLANILGSSGLLISKVKSLPVITQ